MTSTDSLSAKNEMPDACSRMAADWNPRAPEVLRDQTAAYDDLRARCPVAYSAYMHWSVLRHGDVTAILDDHANYSSAVSAHLSVPNGMDPPEHGKFRPIVERYFDDDAMRAFDPVCRRIAAEIADTLPADGEIDVIPAIAEDFALKVQCAFMGWHASLHGPLRDWTKRNAAATLARDRAAMADVATQFDGYIRNQLDARRAAGDGAPDDATTRLLRETVEGRPLRDAEITSIIRNWTVGELGTIAASVGIVLHYLAERPDLLANLRARPADLGPAIDEILRIHPPLISNRRVTTCPVELGERQIPAGARLTILWASANRDERVFGDPDRYDPAGNAAQNLLYGAGIHVCPGAPLARLELKIVITALLERIEALTFPGDRPPERAIYPGSGFRRLPLRIRCADRGEA